MEIEVTELTRRGAAVMHRSHRVSADHLSFGRGTDNEVPLHDIRIELHAAALWPREGGGLRIESLSVSPLRVNGRSVNSAPVAPGDEVLVGPYRIRFGDPPAGCDAALSVELVQPLDNTLVALTARSRLEIGGHVLNKRALSWTAFVVVALVSLVAPIAIYALGLVPQWRERTPAPGPTGLVALSWNAGSLSNTHRAFATDCTACHQAAFRAVPDVACLACHGGVGAHIEKTAELGPMRAAIEERRCTHCHEEHRGLRGMVIREASLCVECHRTLADSAPGARLENVGGFPTGHPQFRPTLVADAAKKTLVRQEIGANPPPEDHPGLHFSHAAHLVKGGFPTLGYKEMRCADCHIAEPGGEGFQPITYDKQCRSCHALKFDRADLPWADATVPHGDDSGIVAAVWNYYAAKALVGGPAPADPAPPPVARQAAGAAPPPAMAAPPDDVRGRVAAAARSALRNVILDDKRGCAYCHFGTGTNGAFEPDKFLPMPMSPVATRQIRIVAPVLMETRFLPKARFDHASHTASNCEDCHNARKSERASDVLIPGEATCERCHGAENAALQSQSTCITCHVFHHNEFGPMRDTAAAIH